jgi:hypothetical protein
MEIALIKTKLRTKTIIKQSITANSNKKTEKPKPQEQPQEERIGPHLTVSGVCTTIRPEKSGT